MSNDFKPFPPFPQAPPDPRTLDSRTDPRVDSLGREFRVPDAPKASSICQAMFQDKDQTLDCVKVVNHQEKLHATAGGVMWESPRLL